MIKSYYLKLQMLIPKKFESEVPPDTEVLKELKDILSEELSDEIETKIVTSTNINDIILSEANYEL